MRPDISPGQYSSVFLTEGLTPSKAKARYATRRKNFISDYSSPVVIASLTKHPGSEAIWDNSAKRFNQEPLFFYLTGVMTAGAAIALFPSLSSMKNISDFFFPETNHVKFFREVNGKSHYEIIFLPPKDPTKEFWNGKTIGAGSYESEKEVYRLTGIGQCADIRTLEKTVNRYIQISNRARVFYFWNSYKNKLIQDFLYTSKKKFHKKLKKLNPNVKTVNCFNTVWKRRPFLDKHDIDNLKAAARITKKSYEEMLSFIRAYKSSSPHTSLDEHTLGLNLDTSIRGKTPFGTAFPTICAAGKNAAVLHYTEKNSQVEINEMVLFDFGVRVHSVVTDVSRTIVPYGEPSEIQKEIFHIVLSAGETVCEAAGPDTTINDLDRLCWNTVNKRLKQFLKATGIKGKFPYDRKPHGVSHLIGIAVHDGDPFGVFKEKPLQPGHLISNEPGIYGTFTWKEKGHERRETLGVRIEDDLLITKSGCENITADIPKLLTV